MDYEKLHKDTITKLQEMVNSGKITVEIARGICADFIPENEDERIRKEMLIFFKNFSEHGTWKDIRDVGEWIAWLEKQGQVNEPSTSEDERTWIINYLSNRILNSSIIAEKENLKKAIAWLEAQYADPIKEYWRGYNEGKQNVLDKYAELEKQGEQKPVIKLELDDNGEPVLTPFEAELFSMMSEAWQCYSFGEEVNIAKIVKAHSIELLERADEQNPAWSEEDNNKINSIKYLLHELDNYNFDNWLRNLKDRVQPQPKQEWSEEDEKKINYLIALLQNSTMHNSTLRTANEEIENWLKSLRPQSTWKPSEQDILLLERISNGKSDPRDFQATLCCLIEQLKKLKG